MKSGVGRYNLRVYAKDYIEYNQESELFSLLDDITDFGNPVTISFWDVTDDLCAKFNNKILMGYVKMYPSILFEIYNADNYFRFAWFDMLNSTMCTKFDRYKFRYSYNTQASFKQGFSNFKVLLNAVGKMNNINEGYTNYNGTENYNKNRNIRVKHIPATKSN